MKRAADKRTIEIWLECYNRLSGTNFRIESYPDEIDRCKQSIDAWCVDGNGLTLGLEHTRVEAFPGEMADNARFMEVFGRFEKDPALSEFGVQTSACIQVGAIPKGIPWERTAADLGAFLKKHVPGLGIGLHSLTFAQESVFIPLEIRKTERIAGQPGVFLVSRRWPGKSNEATLQKAFTEKLPKLQASAASRTILLLEQNSIAGAAFSDFIEYFAVNESPVWMPDEMWLAWTAAMDTENYLHIARLHPDRNALRADWDNGRITSKYP